MRKGINNRKFIKKRRLSPIIFIGFILAGFCYWNFSPKPRAFLIRRAFKGGTFVPSSGFNNAKNKTKIIKDISYNSKFPEGKLDIIYPKNNLEINSTIFWVHGGGFVGGDKSDITGYAIELAARGYTVLNINYALAPKSLYPTPVIQIGEVYEYIKENAKKLHIHLDNVFFAGDSAGAQISSQFVNIQTSQEYAKLTKINAIVEPSTIKGVLLFCGPYNMPRLAEIESSNLIRNFMHTVGWAYLGKKDWEGSTEVKIASILNHVTKDFPPTFITDGNTGSFENQGKELISVLQGKGVPVTSLFFDKNVYGELVHEFQFKMNTRVGQETIEKVFEFLDKKSNNRN